MTRPVGFGSRALGRHPRLRALLVRVRAWSLFGLMLMGGLGAAGHARAQGSPAAPVIDPIDIPPDRDPLAHAWDRPGDRGGFYSRLSLGFLGFQSTRFGAVPWENDESRSLMARGFASGFGLDVGGALTHWFALHLTGHIGVLWNGDLDLEFGIAGSTPDVVRLSTYGVAPGATFFTPYDFFFTTAFGVGLAHTKTADYVNTTNPGFFMNLVAGKDLYVSPQFTFGIQFQIAYLLAGDERKVDEARVREFLFGLSFAYDSR